MERLNPPQLNIFFRRDDPGDEAQTNTEPITPEVGYELGDLFDPTPPPEPPPELIL